MKRISRHLIPAAAITICVIAATVVRAQDEDQGNEANRYVVTNLVSDLPGQANVRDTNLKTSWGVAFSPAASPFWIADNATGLSTLYQGDGTIVPLVVTIPCPPHPGQGSSCPQTAAPTGVAWNPTTNPTTAFLVPGTTKPASFIFATEDGTISAWTGGLTPPDAAVLAVDNSTNPTAAFGAVY